MVEQRTTYPLSYSRLSTATECDYRYWVRYHKRFKPGIESSFFIVGKLIHKAIEAFYGNSEVQTETEENQLRFLRAELEKNWSERFDTLLVSQLCKHREWYNEALEDTNRAFKAKNGRDSKAPQMTNYFKDLYEQGLNNRLQEINAYAEEKFSQIKFRKPVGTLFADSDRCLVNFLKLHSQSHVQGEIFCEVEILGIELHGVKTGGFIDRLERAESGISIYDYKTGSSRWDVQKVANDDQLAWYAYAVREMFGELPQEVGIWDLLHGDIIRYKISETDIERFLLRTQGKVVKKKQLDEYFKQVDSAKEQPIFQVPAGRNSDICKNCDLAIEPNDEFRCKFYHMIDK